MTIMPIEKEQWRSLINEWNLRRGPYFQIRESDLLWNLNEQSLLNYRFTYLANVAVIYATATDEGIENGLSSESLWLSLWGDIKSGREKEFAEAFINLARENSKSRCAIGGEEFHFLPGIPLDDQKSDESLLASLEDLNFKTVEECDFVGDIHNEAVTRYIDESRSEAQKRSWFLSEASSVEEKKTLLSFLQNEFPGRWTREYKFYLANQDSSRAQWSHLKNEHDVVIGFARTAIRKNRTPLDEGWTPAALRLPLTADKTNAWAAQDGCLGPIGVANSARGKGAGRVLLGLVLQSLREHGTNRTCIDWTDALKYYEPLRFDIVRRYKTTWRSEENS